MWPQASWPAGRPAHQWPAHQWPAHQWPAHQWPAHQWPAHQWPAHQWPARLPATQPQAPNCFSGRNWWGRRTRQLLKTTATRETKDPRKLRVENFVLPLPTSPLRHSSTMTSVKRPYGRWSHRSLISDLLWRLGRKQWWMTTKSACISAQGRDLGISLRDFGLIKALSSTEGQTRAPYLLRAFLECGCGAYLVMAMASLNPSLTNPKDDPGRCWYSPVMPRGWKPPLV